MLYLLIAGIIFNYMGDGCIEYMLLMYRSLQLILHLPLTQVIVPANVIVIVSKALNVVQYDI